MKKIAYLFFVFLIISSIPAYATPVGEFCKELGKEYLKRGDIDQARIEFTKAQILDPSDKEAASYLESIRKKNITSVLNVYEAAAPAARRTVRVPAAKKSSAAMPAEDVPASQPGTQLAWGRESPADFFERGTVSEAPAPAAPVSETVPPKVAQDTAPVGNAPDGDKSEKKKTGWGNFEVTGNYQIAVGASSDGAFGKRTNYGLNERNWRVLSDAALNNRENTYDPSVFSQFRFSIDYPQEQGWSFHSKFDVSPWSFIGKSDKVTLTTAGGDTVDVELKYWSNTGYTLDQTYYTNLKGDSFSMPELKVYGDKIVPTTLTTTWGDTIDIPGLKIHREFQPLRELSFMYNNDTTSLDIFPWASDTKAYTSDDPLGLSNHVTYWEESQWLVKWQPGHFNSDAAARDFQQGWWDDTLAFAVRDAGNVRLTALRGLTASHAFGDLGVDLSVSSPKDVWQDYGEVDTINSVLRGKYPAADNLSLGMMYASKTGYIEDSIDAENHVVSFDANYGLSDTTQLYMEVATSRSEYDKKSDYSTEKKGNALHLQVVSSSANKFGKTYFEHLPEKKEFLYRTRLSLTHMDEGFESALSSYRFTRSDTFWGRHLTFREPFHAFIPSLQEPAVTWYDIRDFRIGDGIDYGRDVASFRYEAFNMLDSRLDVLFDIRNVHSTGGKYIENVSRAEATYRANKKWTTKIMGLYHDLPDTIEGIDPFLFDPLTGEHYKDWSSDAIDGGKDPSLKTVSLGSEYWITDKVAVNGILEVTNDCTLAYDNYPRALFNDAQPSNIFYLYDSAYRANNLYVYNQQYFNQPPYPWYNIYKLGLKIRPSEKTNVYLSYTRNEYEWAQSTDDNMNNIGFDVEHMLNEKLAAHFWYVYSRAKNVTKLIEEGIVDVEDHHNVFVELGYMPEKDSRVRLLYGVGNMAYYANPSFNPYGGMSVLDTQHILRLYYERKF